MDRESAFINYMQNGFEKLNYDTKIIQSLAKINQIFVDLIDDVIVIYKNETTTKKNTFKKFKLGDIAIYVHLKLYENFKKVFRYHLNDDIVTFDNLIHVCMIIKNAGEEFENILRQNLPYVDKWTILDTGSTDGTIEIIKKVLKNVDGKLYEEPFINFRDSRNRCLDLVEQSNGVPCIYNIMLDDTYVLKGDIRKYLQKYRNDSTVDSFHIYIKCDEGKYASNRICRIDSHLRYIFKIHEVIQNYDNHLEDINSEDLYILDVNNDYMKKRTKERKIYDILLLKEEITENPNQPRNYFYMAQTYISLENYQKAVEYYIKRTEFEGIGNREEVTECFYNIGLIGEQHLGWTWNKCEYYLQKCHIHEPRKPDALYYLGYHYVYHGEKKKGFNFLKKAFLLGNPPIFNLFVRDNDIYNSKLPECIIPLCYEFEEFELGYDACERYLGNNEFDITVKSWQNIYLLLKHNDTYAQIAPKNNDDINICFIADGGFKKWDGNSIYENGVGGSETYIIEMAKYIAVNKNYKVHVFCNNGYKECSKVIDGVRYHNIQYYVKFLHEYSIHTAIISRYSEYIPVTVKNGIDNIYLVLHDLTQNSDVMCEIGKFRILCMSPWHAKFYLEKYSYLEKYIDYFPNGINIPKFITNNINKVKYSFIYSSFPNRGLIHLLEIFPRIKQILPNATLNIFCDLDNSYVQTVAHDEMEKIKVLIEQQKEYVTNHGWVTKDILREYWFKSEIWLYPCTFVETFCITALEAAASCTLAITNDLGALVDTVGDRGIIVEGDPATEIWKNEIINTIQKIYKKPEQCKDLLIKNKKWAENYDWSSLANCFNDLYIKKLIYANMYNWSSDVPTGSKKIFTNILSRFKDKKIHILEIGTFTGTSIINMLLELPNAKATVIDTWIDYDEEDGLTSEIFSNEIEHKFYQNVKMFDVVDKITTMKGDSKIKLGELIEKNQKFDLIYIDGSHLCLNCYADIILSWFLLKPGGVMAIDDYLWTGGKNIIDSPKEAVNLFIKEFKDKINILDIGYRVFVEKI